MAPFSYSEGVKPSQGGFSSGDKVEDTPNALHHLYEDLKKLERDSLFWNFGHYELESSYFTAPPMILLLGQYSTGKTSFVLDFLDNTAYPGMNIKAIPSTDKFTVITHADYMPGGAEGAVLPGNLLVVNDRLSFGSLGSKGAFLEDLVGTPVRKEQLRDLIIVDTPGILAEVRSQHGTARSTYDINRILPHFIERADLILLFFDPSKVNISGEFQKTMRLLRPYRNRLRVILNKADTVSPEQLMDIYGNIMWELGRLFDKKEGAKIYMGSFQERALCHTYFQGVFKAHQQELQDEIQGLKAVAMQNKLSYFKKRIKMAIAHAHMVVYLRNRCRPSTWSDKSQEDFQNNVSRELPRIFQDVSKSLGENSIDRAHLPDFEFMKKWLSPDEFDFKSLKNIKMAHSDIKKCAKELEERVDEIFRNQKRRKSHQNLTSTRSVRQAVYLGEVGQSPGGQELPGVDEQLQPGNGFFVEDGASSTDDLPRDQGPHDTEEVPGCDEKWPPGKEFSNEDVASWTGKFLRSKGTAAMNVRIFKAKELLTALFPRFPMENYSQTLRQADLDGDGRLDEDEWKLACFIISKRLKGNEIPRVLPKSWILPQKRHLCPNST